MQIKVVSDFGLHSDSFEMIDIFHDTKKEKRKKKKKKTTHKRKKNQIIVCLTLCTSIKENPSEVTH